jgi:DNA-directed RNA polymerase subunit RPC12/RpoP
MKIEPTFLAHCGLYCGVCGVYYATRDNNEKSLERLLSMYQEKIPGLDDISIDDLKCEGCLSDRVSLFCRTCSIKACNQEKGYSGCHKCDEFPCDHIGNFPVAVGKKVILRTVPYRREYGTEKWVIDEDARYACPECGHKILRPLKRLKRPFLTPKRAV